MKSATAIANVLNNGLMGGYAERMPTAAEKYGTNLLGGNYAKLGETMGLYGERVEKPGEIVPAIRRALEANQSGQSAIIEVMTREEPAFPKVSWA